MNQRISRESARLIASLDPDTRYIKFDTFVTSYIAVICSQITDDELADVLAGDGKSWVFEDRSKALRQLRRLNKNVQIYQGLSSHPVSY